MSWDGIKTFFLSQWGGVAGPGLYMIAGLAAATGAIWLLFSWSFASTVASLRARLKLAEERNLAFATAFHGRTVDEVAGRLKVLEGHVALLPPRRLTEEQRFKLAAIAAPPSDASYLAIIYDGAIEEVGRYARDFIEAFAMAPGWNVVDHPHPRMQRLLFDIAVGVADAHDPTPSELIISAALRDAGVKHDVVERTHHGGDAQIIVSAR